MINDICLRNDYEFLVNRVTISSDSNNLAFLDAIFIPFRKRHVNVNELLQILHFYTGPIYLMLSEKEDLKDVLWDNQQKVFPLLIDNRDFLLFFNSLLTTNTNALSNVT